VYQNKPTPQPINHYNIPLPGYCMVKKKKRKEVNIKWQKLMFFNNNK